MKVTIQDKQEPKELPFPKLMINNDGELFYFVRKNYGLPLNGEGWDFSEKDFATFSKEAAHLHKFTDFHGTITIEQP